MSLSERVKQARALAGSLGNRELDRLAGLAEGHTWAIETGARTNAEARTVAAIAGVLGVSLDWLVAGHGRAPSARTVRAAVAVARKRATAA